METPESVQPPTHRNPKRPFDTPIKDSVAID
jgi:hypothetical protein